MVLVMLIILSIHACLASPCCYHCLVSIVCMLLDCSLACIARFIRPTYSGAELLLYLARDPTKGRHTKAQGCQIKRTIKGTTKAQTQPLPLKLPQVHDGRKSHD